MNTPIVAIGALITGIGLFLKSDKKELTEKPKSTINDSEGNNHAKSKEDESNQNHSNSSDSGSADLDDLGEDEKPE